MGYNTYYHIDVDIESSDDFKETFEEISGYYPDYYDNTFYIDGKWYDHEGDLKVISSRFPDKLITVKGYGEEQPDIWIGYFKNGQGYKVKVPIIFPEFQENLLRP